METDTKDLWKDVMVVLEEVLTMAWEEAIKAGKKDDPFSQGQLMAYFHVLDWAKLQAELAELPPFAYRALNELDPYSLLRKSGPMPENAKPTGARS